MSGTSLDGADAMLADFSGSQPTVLAFASENYPTALREELLALNSAGANEIERSALAANALADVYARAVASVLKMAAVPASQVRAIGCHGQTVRHRPDLGFTIQLNNPARLVELTNIAVVSDFRARDVAAGGQGAPLVPAFHDGVFRANDETRVIVNIGGIANLTILTPNEPAWGFDCGPGNCLMDLWAANHLQKPIDIDGAWAAQGQALERLSGRLHSELFFSAPPPKSTGRDLFHADWLHRHLESDMAAVDVQATLLDLTAWCIVDHAARVAPTATRLIVCGGGARNGALMRAITKRFSCGAVDISDAHGVPSQQVEALAFARFTKMHLDGRALDLSRSTGAKHAAIAGCYTPL